MSKTIKIIDLFIKYPKNEIQPKKIKYRGKKYVYNGYAVLQQIIEDYGKDIVNLLEDEVEIIEEQEEIDKLEIDDNGFIHTNNGTWKGRKLDVAFAESINKLAEAIKNIKEK